MNPYRDLDDAYRRLSRSRQRSNAFAAIDGGDLDTIVASVRNYPVDSSKSDRTLRSLIGIGRTNPDALTVALFALAPELQARVSRSATPEYQLDVLGDLTLVLLDSQHLERSHLAHRLVNRAHSRAWRGARRARTRGVLNVTSIVPCEPDRLGRLASALVVTETAIADTVADRVDLQRFVHAVDEAIRDGALPADAWHTYRQHRLTRAIAGPTPPSTSRERVAAHRAARRLAPYIETHLGMHAA